MKVVTKEFLNNNEFNPYPFHVRATLEPNSSSDKSLVFSLLTDMHLAVPRNMAESVYVADISSSKSLVTMTIMGSLSRAFSSDPSLPPVFGDINDPEYQFLGAKVLARVQVRKSANLPGLPVNVIPVQPGVGGWVVFGSGILNEGSWRFININTSGIADECISFYQYGGVTTLGKQGFSTAVSGDVTLTGQGGIEVVPDDVGLSLRFSGSSLDVKQNLNFFKGACGGRPESSTCAYSAIRSINGIVPQGEDREIVLVLDKPMYATLEGVGDDELLAVSSDMPQELFCAGRLDVPDGCNTGTPPATPFLRSAYSPPAVSPTLSSSTRMTFQVSDSDGIRSAGFSYQQQHATRPSVAVLVLDGGSFSLLGEQITHLHMDLGLREWQLYGPSGPSLYGFGALFNNLRGDRTFTHMGRQYYMSLGLMSMYDSMGITRIRVSIAAPDLFEEAGVYVKERYCRYVHELRPEYALELRGAPDDSWAILHNGLVVAAGALSDTGTSAQVQGYIRSNGESSMRTIAVEGISNG